MGSSNDQDEGTAAFIARRNRQQATSSPADARATAHQAFGQSIRTGQTLGLQQPGDVLAYGAQLASPPTTTSSPSPTSGGTSQPGWLESAREAAFQADTAMRSAANAVTFGGADRAAAAIDALFAPGGMATWQQRYNADLQQQNARNQYDASHRSGAQSVGYVGGGLLGLGVLGPLDGGLAATTRLPGAAALTAREIGGVLGAGAATGVGSELITDAATGRRPSPGDIAGAAVGGISGAAALPLGPGRAGAISGAVTSTAQDLLNGRPVSFPQATEGALAGNVVGGIAGSAGRTWSNSLSTTAKGRLGETLGAIRAELSGEGRWGGPKQRAPVAEGGPNTNAKGAYWYPDDTSGPIPENWSDPMPTMFEYKFGPGATLSPNQARAQMQLGSKFILYQFLPSDVGLMTGLPAAGFGPQIVNRGQSR